MYTINRVGEKIALARVSSSLVLIFFLFLLLRETPEIWRGSNKMIVDISYCLACFNWYSACFTYDVRRLIYLLTLLLVADFAVIYDFV